MSKGEKTFIIFYLLYIVAYIPCFFYFMPSHFNIVFPFHILGMILGIIFIIILIRDIYKRDFPNPNSKVTWTILMLMFWPSVFVYLPMYGFKPRMALEGSEKPRGIDTRDKVILVMFGGIVFVSILIFLVVALSMLQPFGNDIQELAIDGNTIKLKELLAEKPELSNTIREQDRWTPLHGAAYNGNTEAVRILLEAGADVNVRNINKRSPLHGAAQGGYLEIVRLLIEAGANPNFIGFQGNTALDWAIKHNRTDIVEYLREHGALTSDELKNKEGIGSGLN